MSEYFKKATIKNMETINIKRISVSDIEQLQKIGRKTFYETFSEVNTQERISI
jgi:diamine N-acetyltransferase